MFTLTLDFRLVSFNSNTLRDNINPKALFLFSFFALILKYLKNISNWTVNVSSTQELQTHHSCRTNAEWISGAGHIFDGLRHILEQLVRAGLDI